MEMEYRGFTIKIVPDESPEDPTEDDCFSSKMVCFHKKYKLGTKHYYKKENFQDLESLKRQIIEDEDPDVIMPMYLFDHGSIHITVNRQECVNADSYGWDWWQVGWAFMSDPDYTAGQISKIIESEVEVYSQYVNGDVFGYVVEKDDMVCDSCFGFFGYESAIKAAKEFCDEAGSDE